jgi:hypothetical protein
LRENQLKISDLKNKMEADDKEFEGLKGFKTLKVEP